MTPVWNSPPSASGGHARTPTNSPPMSTTTDTGSIHVTGIDLSAYMTNDLERSLAFYRTIGLEPTTVYPEQAGAEFTFADGSTFGLWNPRGMMPFQPASGVMLAVEDFPATLQVLEAARHPDRDAERKSGLLHGDGGGSGRQPRDPPQTQARQRLTSAGAPTVQLIRTLLHASRLTL